MADTHTNPFLALARDAYSESTSYFDAGIRRDIEGAMRQFQGLHPHGSKYLHESYRARARFHRPKARAAERKNEAVAAAALFSNRDVITIGPEDDTNPVQVASAAVWHEVMNYRLTKSVPWFQTSIGAYQDAMVTGVCISYQYWKFNEKRKIDTPSISLKAVENIRFSPAAEWTDPVGTSPYFIELIPMFVKDVVARMDRGIDDKGASKRPWQKLDQTALLASARSYSDSIKLQREQGRADSQQISAINDFTLVWVHRNFMEVNGTDYVYYTLGTQDMLSVPERVEQCYPPLDGERPYVIGNCVIETHKQYPSGPIHLGRDIIAELNNNANQRSDNVSFAMNKRYFVKRGRQVDVRSLQRNIPSSVTMMEDPEKDVHVVETKDVTRSAYEEQDRYNLDYDDLMGTFSQASAQSSRRIVDSKGGLELLSADGNQMSAYQLQVWVETWVKPTVRQMLKFEQAYETDEVIFTLAGKKAQSTQRLNDPIVIDDKLLMQDLTCKIDVGIGATSPQARLQNFTDAMTAAKNILEDDVITKNGGDPKAITDEIFSKLGYDGGERFFPDKGQDPKLAEMQAQLDEANAKLAKREDPELTKAKIAKLLAESSKIGADKVKSTVEAIFGAMQAAEVIAAVPDVAPIADGLMKAGGYTEPTPPGIDPGFAPGEQGPNNVIPGAAAGLTVQPVTNKRTGVGFTPGAPPGDPTPGIQTNTNPLTPAKPASPFVGPNAGIETARPDTAGPQR